MFVLSVGECTFSLGYPIKRRVKRTLLCYVGLQNPNACGDFETFSRNECTYINERFALSNCAKSRKSFYRQSVETKLTLLKKKKLYQKSVAENNPKCFFHRVLSIGIIEFWFNFILSVRAPVGTWIFPKSTFLKNWKNIFSRKYSYSRRLWHSRRFRPVRHTRTANRIQNHILPTN